MRDNNVSLSFDILLYAPEFLWCLHNPQFIKEYSTEETQKHKEFQKP